MAAPIGVMVGRYALTRGAAAAGRFVLKKYGKKTAQKRMAQIAARRGGVALSPAPQGPYGAFFIESRGGQHRITSRMARKGRKSMRRPSAQRSKKRRFKYFRRDEERYRGRR